MSRSSLWLGLAALAMFPVECAVTAQVQAPVRAAHDISPQFEVTPIDVGDALMLHQRYQAALEAYSRAPSKSPEAWNKMGLAYQLMFNVEQAERCYRKAMKLDARNGNYINNLGSIYMERKEYSRAEHAFRKAVKQNAQSALFEKNLGTALLAERKYADGWEAYQRALALDPDIFLRVQSGVKVENPATIHDRGAMNFYMAKGCVKAGMLSKAVDYLRLSLNEGFTTPKKVMADMDFAALRQFPGFIEMLAAQGASFQSAAASVTVLHPN